MRRDAPLREDDDAPSAIDALRQAVVTMLAVLATLASVLAIDAEAGPAILAVVLALSLARSHLDRDLAGRIEALLVLPLVGLLATGVGVLLVRAPWFGALAFTAGLFVSIWLRRFGPLAARAGSLIALPFVAILVTPYLPTHRLGPVLATLMPILVALIALAWVALLQTLARVMRVLPPIGPRVRDSAPPRERAPSTLRPDAPTRLAVQMAVAIAASFAVGFACFGEHAMWVVLTAFIVGSGNRGRLDVAYKSLLRIAGAAAGTMLALTFAIHLGARDGTTVALILAAIFLGVWLRPLGYAWWALFVTLALALLENFTGRSASGILWPRLEAIVVGAGIGVASAWFVLPLRSIDVLRRRIADALAALAAAIEPDAGDGARAAFAHALDRVEKVAPAFRAFRHVSRRAPRPADWIDALLACRASARAAIAAGSHPPTLRRAIGAARQALREPARLDAALSDLRRALAEAVPASPAPDRPGPPSVQEAPG